MRVKQPPSVSSKKADTSNKKNARNLTIFRLDSSLKEMFRPFREEKIALQHDGSVSTSGTESVISADQEVNCRTLTVLHFDFPSILLVKKRSH
ncbi:hypothetical protein BHE74_00038155 [Ensete ventricosum]|nr:hypothetical protein GW17_00033078 [Ensete ventricosum]RWW55222.1 hypothetical protein BHE74_00038155 [Ensete ventricosum]RZS04735.1 hypothetical protein BHM03_00035109 [Ensete ventricosum]